MHYAVLYLFFLFLLQKKKIEKYQNFSAEKFQFLKAQNISVYCMGKLMTSEELDQLANLHSDTLRDLAPLS